MRDADAAALDPRSDSINISHYTVNLDFSELPQPGIKAACTVDFAALLDGISHLTLDLEGLTVDSVMQGPSGPFGNIPLAFNHVGSKLHILLSQQLNAGESANVTVYYQGMPVEDASGFGGFSFSGSYAYNIGVGFEADPHNFGRVWFPCFDNFVERSTYTCIVKMPENYRAYCGGMLVSNAVEGGVRTMVWDLNQEVPSYLASVAVAPYTEVNDTFNSIVNPSLPVVLAALPADTIALKNAFVSLEPIFEEFESHFGPYRWDRIGYVLVPFQAGAMEHATNIAFMRDLVPFGAASNQHIMAHELAHHWFGDLATCRTASEMWLNEGWASYTERLFDEWLINRATYDANVRSNHKEMLQFAHVRDGGYWPLNNVPHAYTYSNHTYELPSDKIHTLRTYMGDSLFYAGLRHYLNTHLFTHATSEDLENALEEETGLELSNYFDDWIETPGWAGFEVDSFRFEPGEIGMVEVFYSQKSAGNSHTFSNVPFEVSLIFSDLSSIESQQLLSGPSGSFSIESNSEPLFVFLNRNEGISQAVTADEKMIKLQGNVALSNALTEIYVEDISDSAFVRAEHYWVAPDPFKQPYAMYRLSPNRYWKFDIHPKGNFKARLKINFNGRTTTNDAGWLDHNLITNESKLVLLHRKNNYDDWQLVNAEVTTYGNLTDKFGKIELDSLMAGEYTLAEVDSSLGVESILMNGNEIRLGIKPNPTNDFVDVDFGAKKINSIELISMDGKSLGFFCPESNNSSIRLPTSHLPAGIYFVKALSPNGKIISARLIKN
jgi:aminopeptidase N